MKCNELIENIYTHPKITELLSKIKPVDLQDDLRQELALTLLNYDCDKLLKIDKEGNIINYALKTLWNIGTYSEGEFNRKFKKLDLKINDYLRSQQWNGISLNKATKAKEILNNKLETDANNAHEAILFNKYVELRSYQKVADYFKIPRIHVMRVINATKKELKQKLYD